MEPLRKVICFSDQNSCHNLEEFGSHFWVIFEDSESKGLFQHPSTLYKAELPQLNHTQFPSLGFFVSKKVGNQKN